MPREGVFDGQTWTYRNGFDDVLRRIPTVAWEDPRLLRFQRIKENARREVWRAPIGDAVYYLKFYAEDDWKSRAKRVFRASACLAEWAGGLYALQSGIPAVAPAGYTTTLRRKGRTYALLVTEAVEPATALGEFWQRLVSDEDEQRRREDARHLIDRLGEALALAHQAGFEHLDMHAANILVQPVGPRRYRTVFVDLHSARLGLPVTDKAVIRNLAQLNQWFRRHASIKDRLRLLRAYFRWRNEYEHAFRHGRALGMSFEALVMRMHQQAQSHAEQLGRQRDRRALRDGRYFTRLRCGGWRGVALVRTKHATVESRASELELDRAWWRDQLTDPLRWLRDRDSALCKDSHSAEVARGTLDHPSDPLPVIVKRPRARNWRRRLSLWLNRSRSRRGWQMGHALLHRHVATARPLAMLERRRGPITLDSLLITECVPGAVDLETYLRESLTRLGNRAAWQFKRSLAKDVARHVRTLEERGFVHDDCKASNILITAPPEQKLLWIDMDGIRRRRRPALRPFFGHKALIQLHVSLLALSGISRTDRARFLKEYCARFGVDEGAWRRLWHTLAPAALAKTRAKQRRKAWKQKRYGRE